METPLRIRNVLFKAFLINLLVVIIVWLLSLAGVTTNLMSAFFGFTAEETRMYLANLIGLWKILNVVFFFFLVPAIAIHWEYRGRR